MNVPAIERAIIREKDNKQKIDKIKNHLIMRKCRMDRQITMFLDDNPEVATEHSQEMDKLTHRYAQVTRLIRVCDGYSK